MKFGEHCNEISIIKPNYLESREVERIVSKKGTRKKVEWHDGQCTNTKRNIRASLYASMELLDESDSKT
ncbi:hypothetical protein EPI10_031629 [Gossypium australe]|uniref:Uncharacterized protein n=1 Tax=Gossypium australe TaxID=47621 RepID=A0A5B6X2M7_9ROSI|nr:hypothetical protein EPI10_031629 [Gossypium australe]